MYRLYRQCFNHSELKSLTSPEPQAAVVYLLVQESATTSTFVVSGVGGHLEVNSVWLQLCIVAPSFNVKSEIAAHVVT